MGESVRNLSYSLNSFGFGDELQSSIAGNGARVNFFDNIGVAKTIAQSSPQSYSETQPTPPSQTQYNPRSWYDYANPMQLGMETGASIVDKGGLASYLGIDLTKSAKYVLLAVLALIIIAFGLYALLKPEIKTIGGMAA